MIIESPNTVILNLLNGATFACLFGWAVFAIRRLSRGVGRPVYFLFIVHFVFCGIPPMLDLLFGQPEYLSQPGFYDATRDLATAGIYSLYVCLCPAVWLIAFRRRQSSRIEQTEHDWVSASHQARALYAMVMMIPLLTVLLSPQRSRYLDYGAALQVIQNDQAASWHRLLAIACMIAVLATAGLLLRSKRWKLPLLLFAASLLVVNCWLHGKRSIIAITMVMVGYVLWERRILRGKKLIVASIAATIVFATFSMVYQTSLWGGRAAVANHGLYENVRIDYGRDDVIKMTIHAELHPEQRQILEFRGQSLLFYATIWVPREIWPNKPWPYSVYFTSAMLNLPRPRSLNWGMTTSWLEELIANLGWLGIFVAPLSLAALCHIGWSRGDAQTTFLTLLVASLFMSVHLSAFFTVFALWVVRIVLTRKRRSPIETRPGAARDPAHVVAAPS